jgi:hypothetical protein
MSTIIRTLCAAVLVLQLLAAGAAGARPDERCYDNAGYENAGYDAVCDSWRPVG